MPQHSTIIEDLKEEEISFAQSTKSRPFQASSAEHIHSFKGKSQPSSNQERLSTPSEQHKVAGTTAQDIEESLRTGAGSEDKDNSSKHVANSLSH